METKKGHKKGYIDDHFCDLFMTFFSIFLNGLSTYSSTQIADSSVHSTHVIYNYGELGYFTMSLCG